MSGIRHRLYSYGLILLGLWIILAPAVSRADGWFMKIDGVPGMVTQGRSAGWTPIHSAGALVCHPVNTTNATQGLAEFVCEVRKSFDCTSPWLLQACGQGETNRRVTLTCTLTEPGARLHRITLQNVLVASVEQEANSLKTTQTEVVRFTFDKIEMAWLELDPNGGTAGGLTAVCDQSTGQGVLKSRPPFQVTIARQGGNPGVVVTWPAEGGHRYRILSRATLSEPWNTLAESTASDDGPLSQLLSAAAPALFMRVEEVD